MQHAGQGDVSTELTAPFQETSVLQSRQTCSDAETAHVDASVTSGGSVVRNAALDRRCGSNDTGNQPSPGFCIEITLSNPI
jgi:hypothetical protein